MAPYRTRSVSARTAAARKASSVTLLDLNAVKQQVQDSSFDGNCKTFLESWTEEDCTFANLITSSDFSAAKLYLGPAKPNSGVSQSERSGIVLPSWNNAESTDASVTLPDAKKSQEADEDSDSSDGSSSGYADDLKSDPTWNESTTQDSYEMEIDASSSRCTSPELPPDYEVQYAVTNIVASCNMGIELNLHHIARRAWNTTFKPRRSSGCTIELRRPKAFGTLYRSGKMRIMGVRSVANCERAARKYVCLLRKLGYEQATLSEFKVNNITAQADVGFRIRLPELAFQHNKSCHYEPELSPALSYSMVAPKVTCVVQASGKIRFTGARLTSDLDLALEKLLVILKKFRKV